MCNFHKRSAPYLQKKIINVKYPSGKALEKCGGKGEKQVGLEKQQPDSVWTMPHPADVGQQEHEDYSMKFNLFEDIKCHLSDETSSVLKCSINREEL